MFAAENFFLVLILVLWLKYLSPRKLRLKWVIVIASKSGVLKSRFSLMDGIGAIIKGHVLPNLTLLPWSSTFFPGMMQ